MLTQEILLSVTSTEGERTSSIFSTKETEYSSCRILLRFSLRLCLLSKIPFGKCVSMG